VFDKQPRAFPADVGLKTGAGDLVDSATDLPAQIQKIDGSGQA